MQQQFFQTSNTSVADYIENYNFGKLLSDSPSTCSFSEISSKEESDLELELEERYEQEDSTLYFNPFVDEKEDNQPSDVHEKSRPNFIYEDCNQHVEVSVSNVFK